MKRANLLRVEWKRSDNGGAPKPEAVPGSGHTVEADLVLLAMGFVHVHHTQLLRDLGVELDPRGNIRCDPTYRTSAPGVFAAGDANTGASLVVRAINHGRLAAAEIDKSLKS